jgi:NAD(P)-dependent dehydrogenase (short-subunit alcohol dehydrogenase family)
MLTRTAALELARHNIRVNAVAPGTVDTEMTRQAARDEPGLIDATIAQTPLRKLVAVEDIAQAVLFLCNDAAHSITGTILTVDAGYSLR